MVLCSDKVTSFVWWVESYSSVVHLNDSMIFWVGFPSRFLYNHSLGLLYLFLFFLFFGWLWGSQGILLIPWCWINREVAMGWSKRIKTGLLPELWAFSKRQITSSYFEPYITTVGLYSEDFQLLAVGKLAQPLPTSATTDTTILINIDR